MAGRSPLDMLEMLPLGVLGEIRRCVTETGPTNAWGTFRLASRQSRALVDQCVMSVTHDLRHVPEQAIAAFTGSSDLPRHLPHHWWPAWRHEVQQLSAFLQRLPSLSSLTLKGWSSEAQLVDTLQQCGGATAGRVTHLTMCGVFLSPGEMAAVRQACPRLRHLQLDHLEAERGPGGQPAAFALAAYQLAGPVFDPLHGVGLTKLVMPRWPDTDGGVVPSLGGLTALQHLDLTFSQACLPDLHHLTGLYHLRHVSVHLSNRPGPHDPCLADFAPLLAAATQLTSLELPELTYTNGLGDYAAPITGPAADAMALLGCLTSLRRLHLPSFAVDDAAFAALRQLSGLTELHIALIHLSDPTPGHLPLLQRLHLDALQPCHLVQSLRPLLPLPSLTTLSMPGRAGLDFEVDISHHGEDTTALSLDLHCAALFLAAAPRLAVQNELSLSASSTDDTLDIAQAAHGLQPLAGRFSRLWLRSFTCNQEGREGLERWDALASALPALQTLVLWHCDITWLEAGRLVRLMTALPRLAITKGTLDRQGWLEVAGVRRSRPLLIEVEDGGMPPELLAECQAVQARVDGEQRITWGLCYVPGR